MESDSECNEGMAVEEPEGREKFIRRFMTGEFQCPDDVFKQVKVSLKRQYGPPKS